MPRVNSTYASVYSTQTELAIRNEFKRLTSETYLDHAGASLYSEIQISEITRELCAGIYPNPHTNPEISDTIDLIRCSILGSLFADPTEYSVIFTSGATGALKLVAESFNFGKNGVFAYLEDNHTSVLGMRSYTKNIRPIKRSEAFQTLHEEKRSDFVATHLNNNLFVYPLQCNFSGFKYPLNWVYKIQNGNLNLNSNRTFCLLDAASYLSTNQLDLSKHKPDFVVLSFYKIFGYPTGLGALIVKNSSGYILNKKYFGGGSIFMALPNQNVVHFRQNLHEKFEDGTISYLSILSLRHGFNTFKRLKLTLNEISLHTFNLARYIYTTLIGLKHKNGEKLCVIYSDTDFTHVETQGGILNFNLLRDDGAFIGFSEVRHLANLNKITLRTGCFCNPGACSRFLDINPEKAKHFFEQGHVCGDQLDLIDKQPTGSIRISFGYMSTLEDAKKVISFVKTFISTDLSPSIKSRVPHLNQMYKADLKSIFIYPVKSCGSYEIKNKWNLVETGLKFDHKWMIINSKGVCLTQKNIPKMCLIKPEIDLKREVLILNFDEMESCTVPLDASALSLDDKNYNFCNKIDSKICKDFVRGFDCGQIASLWLSDVLAHDDLRLIKQDSRVNKKNENLSLVNKAPFLLINESSMKHLNLATEFEEEISVTIARFRPNFVVDFGIPFIENNCDSFNFKNIKLLNDGNCTRCQMICVDQTTAEKSGAALRILSQKLNGKITFGVYLKYESFKDFKEIALYVNSEISGYKRMLN